MNGIPIHALTTESHNGLQNVIISPVTLKNTFTGKTLETHAIWDTGATNSVITASAASELGLITIQKALSNGVHGAKEVNVYKLNLTLNNEQIKIDTLVTECVELSANNEINFIIGMNVINLGDFAITNYSGKTMMSFRIPSVQKIDFVRGINGASPLVKDKIPGRNDLCPCGSKKKYKYCHGK